jgi:beta-lactamase superfamily II metal-dependent hydrolase
MAAKRLRRMHSSPQSRQNLQWVGEANQFGHPVDAVLERYAAAGARFLRTDRDGAVTALTDGQTLTVQRFAEEHPQ